MVKNKQLKIGMVETFDRDFKRRQLFDRDL